MRIHQRFGATAAVAALAATALAGCSGSSGSAASTTGASSSSVASATSSAPAKRAPAQDGMLTQLVAQVRGAGHLQPGSDPSVLPGPILIADKLNSRLVIIDPQGRTVWQYPRPGDLAKGQTFKIPDDAFFTPDGRSIIATEEDDNIIRVVDIATHRVSYHYGTAGVFGSTAGHVHHPDDALMLPDRSIISADIINCRVIVLGPGATSVRKQFGTTGHCVHNPPKTYGSPNGAFPLTDGNFLVTEINGSWIDEVTPQGAVKWTAKLPSVNYPSDSNEVRPGVYLTVDYSTPGQIVEFDKTGKILWRFAPRGKEALSQPSLAIPLHNGDVLCNDDANHRVIVVDPRTNKIVWQYGKDHVAGSAPGLLANPDGVDLYPPHSLIIKQAATVGRP